MVSVSSTESKQKQHYERIAESYNQHYSDGWSAKYRDRFFHKAMFDGVELRGQKVLDAMCGFGDATRYLLEHGADVTGLDISPSQIEVYEQRWGCKGLAVSFLDNGLPSESFDLIVACGALHHMPPYLDETMEEIIRLLKPGGTFCFVEPHSHSILEKPRQWWYARDHLFEENEQAIDIDALEKNFCDRFSKMETLFRGSFGYLLVLNSMIFRLPLWSKKYYSPLMFWLEDLVDRIGHRFFTLYVVGRWKKG